MEHRAPNTASLLILGPGQSGRKVGTLWRGSWRACPALDGCTKEEKRPFPNIRCMLLFFSTAFRGEILSAAYMCAGTHPRSSSPCAPVLQDPPMSPGCSSTLRVLTGHPSRQDMSSCSSAAGEGTNTHPAHPHGPLSGDTLPPSQHAFSLSPSTCFLWFHPYFSRQKHSPSLHLPSLYGSQLFFLLFSASYYPGAKNNKEFTALDLELGQAQCSSFCCVSKVLNGSSWVFLASLQVLSPGGTAQHWDAALTGISCETCCELVMLREVRRALWAWGSGVVCEPRSSSPQDVMGFLVFVLSSHVFSLSF